MMPQITYEEDNQNHKVIQQKEEGTILEAALNNDIDHYHVCGGNARCTTCRVYVKAGQENIAPRTQAELKIAQDKNWRNNIRLACQAKVLGDITIKRLVVDDMDADLVRSEGSITTPANERSLVVMFCDLENYTGFAATHLHNPYDVIHLLNRYYQEIGEPIISNHGYIDKYMGDGFLALFGCENNDDATENALNAIRASLRMQARIKQLNKYISRQFSHQFKIRIGLHYGPVIIGEVGYRANKQLTVLGNTVNIASRIESANKTFGTQILASQEFIDCIDNEVEIGEVFNTQLRGQNRSHTLYEIKGFKEPDTFFLAQSILEKVFPFMDEVSKLFYEELFKRDPSLKSLLDTTDAQIQRQMVINMLSVVTQGINNRFDALTPLMLDIYNRHREFYHVKPTYYMTAGNALITVLEKYLGKDFTPAVKNAWLTFYNAMIKLMISDQ
jgi:adenylate cyclase